MNVTIDSVVSTCCCVRREPPRCSCLASPVFIKWALRPLIRRWPSCVMPRNVFAQTFTRTPSSFLIRYCATIRFRGFSFRGRKWSGDEGIIYGRRNAFWPLTVLFEYNWLKNVLISVSLSSSALHQCVSLWLQKIFGALLALALLRAFRFRFFTQLLESCFALDPLRFSLAVVSSYIDKEPSLTTVQQLNTDNFQ